MRHLTRGRAALAAASLALSAPACNKGPAKVALEEADAALAAAAPEIGQYAPEELAALTRALQDARARFGAGRYTDALRVAQGMPARMQAAVAAAGARKAGLVSAWNDVSARVPGLVESVSARVDALVAAQRLPKGTDEATFAAIRTDVGSVAREWDEAKAAFEGGDVPRAVRTARDVEAKALALAGTLGLEGAPSGKGQGGTP
jgi:hypothetical protein